MKKYLVILNNDKRLVYLINKLKEKHEVFSVDDQESLSKQIKLGKYTHLLLPIAGVDNNLNIRGCNIKLTEDLLNYIDNRIILTGLVHEKLQQICNQKGIQLKSYLNKQFAIENNYITCEGIIEKLVNLSEKSIYNANVLVIGYGRLGQILSKVFTTLKANVFVAARSSKDLTSIEVNEYNPVSITNMNSTIKNVDFVINTVPANVISNELLNELTSDNPLILDVGSAPYGLDHDYASKLGLSVHLLPKIPGKIAPKSSGELMAKYISLL